MMNKISLYQYSSSLICSKHIFKISIYNISKEISINKRE